MMRKHRILPEGQEGGRMGTNCFSGKVKDFFAVPARVCPFQSRTSPSRNEARFMKNEQIRATAGFSPRGRLG
jgi:hypothetical protein